MAKHRKDMSFNEVVWNDHRKMTEEEQAAAQVAFTRTVVVKGKVEVPPLSPAVEALVEGVNQ